jgi:hypothetical protein
MFVTEEIKIVKTFSFHDVIPSLWNFADFFLMIMQITCMLFYLR